MTLPSRADMDDDIHRDYELRLSMGISANKAHSMAKNLIWDYDKSLASLAGFEPMPQVVKALYDYNGSMRRRNVLNYKEKEYRISDPETFEEVKVERTHNTIS